MGAVAKSGGDPVDRDLLVDQLLLERATRADGVCGTIREPHGAPPAGDVDRISNRQMRAVKLQQ